MLAALVSLFGLALMGFGYRYIPFMDDRSKVLPGQAVRLADVLISGAPAKVKDVGFAAKTAHLAVPGCCAETGPKTVEAHNDIKAPWPIAAALTTLSGLAALMALQR